MEDAQKVFDQISERDVFSWTSLLCGYAKHGEMGRACEIFDQMLVRNNVSWTGVISGFVGVGRYVEALCYFRDMLCDDKDHKVQANEAILVCVLSACAHLGALDQGHWIHMYIGLSIHGLGKDALRVFNQMLAENVKPNELTSLGVLNACSRSGLVEEGSSIFNDMESLWGVVPKIEHYGCYIDLLGHAGHLEKAFQIVRTMPMEPDIFIWRSLLNGCRIHHDANLAQCIISHVRKMNYCICNGGEVLLSNLYASLGSWEGVAEVRKLMGERRNRSDPGRSWIEVDGVVHEFQVADWLHPQIEEIREKLKEIMNRVSFGGYIANTMHVSFDLNEEEKEQAVAWHSEKLAVAFALMSTLLGTSIRIIKNLRTCEDCHMALKAIFKVYGWEIIVRDRSRFHTFKGGDCSCKDYWKLSAVYVLFFNGKCSFCGVPGTSIHEWSIYANNRPLDLQLLLQEENQEAVGSRSSIEMAAAVEMVAVTELYRNLSHQCLPRSFLMELSLLRIVLSSKYASKPATNAPDENGTLTISLNCQVRKSVKKFYRIPNLFLDLWMIMFSAYPSSTCVNLAVSLDRGILLEVLGYRKAQKDREPQYELCSEAVEIAELKET
ncbi:hypothetical protein Vadar_016876 [Vaccinium darrowii]|uniref:Uncharacterized protein n=1 Tax=Vaccinium darrowii TaxID=229202 RepID=A0ACB7ZL03_9ERIC|nr:hypothetical protein Vadar_016876 [Vaccinium darrowii]